MYESIKVRGQVPWWHSNDVRKERTSKEHKILREKLLAQARNNHDMFYNIFSKNLHLDVRAKQSSTNSLNLDINGLYLFPCNNSIARFEPKQYLYCPVHKLTLVGVDFERLTLATTKQ